MRKLIDIIEANLLQEDTVVEYVKPEAEVEQDGTAINGTYYLIDREGITMHTGKLEYADVAQILNTDVCPEPERHADVNGNKWDVWMVKGSGRNDKLYAMFPNLSGVSMCVLTVA